METNNLNNRNTQTVHKIMLKTIDDIKNFANIAKQYDFEIKLAIEKYEVDAKSIVEIFSLDLNETIDLIVQTTDTKDFLEKIKKYIVNKT